VALHGHPILPARIQSSDSLERKRVVLPPMRTDFEVGELFLIAGEKLVTASGSVDL
jgi:hypothetical protein